MTASAEQAASREREFHDAIAAAVAAKGRLSDELDEFDHRLLERAGPVRGLRVLDAGCGLGRLSRELARRGARVAAFDLAPEMIRVAGHASPQHRIRYDVASYGRLPYRTASFDLVIGKWILHHVPIGSAVTETVRVLKPGGRAVFLENSGRNALLRLARRLLTGRLGVARWGTPDEHPLVARDFAVIERAFASVEHEYPDFYFFRFVDRNVLKYRRLRAFARVLHRLDTFVHRRMPALRPFGHHVLLNCRRA